MNVRRILTTPDVLTLMGPYRPPPIGGAAASTFRTRLQRLPAGWRGSASMQHNPALR